MKVFRLYLFFALLLHGMNASATHAVGGEISYQHLDSNAYLLKVIFYRNCNSVAAPSTIAVNVSNTCGFSNQVIFLDVDTVQDISAICADAVSNCSGGSVRGYERYTYTGMVNLPGACNQWTFSQTISSRSSEITTLGLNNNLYLYADLNNSMEEHSSPEFEPITIPEACINQQYCFTNHVSHPANDSITYHLVDPLQSQSLPVSYLSTYSAIQPVSGTISIDTTDGSLCINATQMEVGVYTIEVNQYRNGVFIGRVIRDLMLIVNSCVNTIPSLSGFNGTANYTVNGCVNYNNCWYVSSVDADMDTTAIRAISALPFPTTLSGFPAQLNICWTPQPIDLINSPYTFLLQVADDHCPFTGIQSKAYTIHVLDTSTNFCRLLLAEQLLSNENNIIVFPNPSDGKFRLKNIPPNATIQIRNMTGQLVYENFTEQDELNVNVNLNDGFYQLTLSDAKKNILRTFKLIIRKD